MTRHINFFGYSLWILDATEQKSGEVLSPTEPLYSPGTLAGYCIFTNALVGILLYGINISRRGYLWKGRLIVSLSGLLLISWLFIYSLNEQATGWLGFVLNNLVAINLYQAENRHFQRAIRHGTKQAKWWFPLIWIVLVITILLLIGT